MKKWLPLSFIAILGLGLTLNFLSNDTPEGFDSEETYAEKEKMSKAERIDGWLEWRTERLQNEDGVVDPNDRLRAVALANQLKDRSQAKNLGVTWELVGPTNLGGRTRGIAFDKDIPGKMWAGGVAGGLYVSENYGRDWAPVESYNQVAPASIAWMDVGADGAIYVATGEGLAQANGTSLNSGNFGDGIWKSSDGGESWVQLESTVAQPDPNFTSSGTWAAVNRVAAHPTDPNLILAADNSGGIFFSNNGGEGAGSFQQASRIGGGAMGGVGQDVRWNADGTIAYATLSGSVFRSTDNGQSWQGSLPGIESGSRAELATAPSNPDVVYATVSVGGGCMRGVYTSKDGGQTWTQIVDDNDPLDPDIFADGNGFGDYCQGWYDQCIAVNPVNENQIYMGGISFFTYEPGIGGVKLADNRGAGELNSTYIHSDKHIIIFDPHDESGETMWVGHDGGLSVSTNAFSGFPDRMNYVERNKNFVTLQPYGIGAGPYGEVLAGSQDQGSTYIDGSGINPTDATFVFGNDGIYAEISNLDPTILYLGWQEGNLLVSANSGASTVSALGGAIDPGSCGTPSGCAGGTTPNCDATYAAFIPPFYLFEPKDSSERDKAKLFFATSCGVWVLLNPLDVQEPPIWQRITNGGGVTAFDMTSDGNTLFFTRSNNVVSITGFNNAILIDSSGSRNPSDIIGLTTNSTSVVGNLEGITVDKNDNDHVVVVAAGFSSGPHVFRSTNATTAMTFTPAHDVSAGSQTLPAMPVYDAAIDFNNPDNYIIGTELGVWTSDDAGVTWTEANDGGLQRVPVVSIRQEYINPETNNNTDCYVLYAGTHGKGSWRSTTLSGGCDTEPFKNPVSIREVNQEIEEITLVPNPVQTTTSLRFALKERSDVSFTITDMAGRIVSSETLGTLPAGEHNEVINAASLSTGSYFIQVFTDSKTPATTVMMKR